ncbi:hypothetical protein YC2023_040215 [Brassica napus]
MGDEDEELLIGSHEDAHVDTFRTAQNNISYARRYAFLLHTKPRSSPSRSLCFLHCDMLLPADYPQWFIKKLLYLLILRWRNNVMLVEEVLRDVRMTARMNGKNQ